MAKLYFRYGAMNSGKSTMLIQAAYNYEERDQVVAILKPAIDTKGAESLSSRIGLSRRADFLLGPDDSLANAVYVAHDRAGRLDAVFIDEAQFLTPEQVDEAFQIALNGTPVLAYGLRADFRTHAFPGSARLMEIAHSIEELKTICRCGSKAMFNARKVDGEFVSEGSQVAIDGVDVGYESLCGKCYSMRVGPIMAKDAFAS